MSSTTSMRSTVVTSCELAFGNHAKTQKDPFNRPGPTASGVDAVEATMLDGLLVYAHPMATHPLETHLQRFAAAPFLFVGAGISRRYLGLENWEGLLRRFSAVAGRPYEYYSSTANGDFLEIATLIAADVHERWWKDEDFSRSREAFKNEATTDESALKIEIAQYLSDCLKNLPDSGVEAEELALLRHVVVDGVITTNFDPLLEHIFDTFKVFIGQDELLFSDPQGVGEIYKIHGSVSAPNSLVLTTRDFDRFRDRNPYLAAKLLTTFVEHPMIFLGYSLSDKNITAILKSIASILTNDRLLELQDRPIFVRWDPDAPDQAALTASSIVADGFTIPVQILPVRDFAGVYGALGNLERRFPARVLRQLKERVYELVRDNDPKRRLFVLDFDADATDVDVVLGVGAIQKLVTSYKGLGRKDILIDAVSNGDELDPARVVGEVLSSIPTNQHVPIYKYLRGADLLTADGELGKGAKVDEKSEHGWRRVLRHSMSCRPI